MTTKTDPMAPDTVVPVPDDPFEWLAIYCDAYATADAAFWSFKHTLSLVERPDTTQQAHLEHLRARRRECYRSIVDQTMLCERLRMEARP